MTDELLEELSTLPLPKVASELSQRVRRAAHAELQKAPRRPRAAAGFQAIFVALVVLSVLHGAWTVGFLETLSP
jgi:hypothetical protein